MQVVVTSPQRRTMAQSHHNNHPRRKNGVYGSFVVLSILLLFSSIMDRLLLEPLRKDIVRLQQAMAADIPDDSPPGLRPAPSTNPPMNINKDHRNNDNRSNNNDLHHRHRIGSIIPSRQKVRTRTRGVISFLQHPRKATKSDRLPRCCVHPVSVVELMRQYTPQFFSKDFFKNDNNQTYENWLAVAPHKITGNQCTDQWRRLTLQETRGGHYFGEVLHELRADAPNLKFPYSVTPPSNQNIPRALFLGDSVSRGTWATLLSTYSNRGVHLAGAPANCYGFDQYKKANSLSHWLGPCSWDFVQFNVGLHFHPQPEGDWRTEYKQEILGVVQTIHAHSPAAKIVIALTTPSPLDTNATYPPDDGSCPHLDKFHRTGFIPSMNDVILSLLQGNETIPGLWAVNDRYSLMATHLIDYQLPCDVHYTESGYQRLAQHDWEMVASAFQITLPIRGDDQ